jgi:hypothetical protein
VSAASEARLAALAAAFDAEMVDLRALALLGADGWRTPSRYQVWCFTKQHNNSILQ